MTAFELFALTGVALFALALLRLVVGTNLLRKVLALNIMSSGAFLVLVATAYRDAGERPDPVPHAMVLTGLVVAVSVTAFALALVRRIEAAQGHAELDPTAEHDG